MLFSEVNSALSCTLGKLNSPYTVVIQNTFLENMIYEMSKLKEQVNDNYL